MATDRALTGKSAATALPPMMTANTKVPKTKRRMASPRPIPLEPTTAC